MAAMENQRSLNLIRGRWLVRTQEQPDASRSGRMMSKSGAGAQAIELERRSCANASQATILRRTRDHQELGF
jgi:hypothetical protein